MPKFRLGAGPASPSERRRRGVRSRSSLRLADVSIVVRIAFRDRLSSSSSPSSTAILFLFRTNLNTSRVYWVRHDHNSPARESRGACLKSRPQSAIPMTPVHGHASSHIPVTGRQTPPHSHKTCPINAKARKQTTYKREFAAPVLSDNEFDRPNDILSDIFPGTPMAPPCAQMSNSVTTLFLS